MAYDYRINAQAPTQGIGAFQAGQQMGGGFGRLAGSVVDNYKKDQNKDRIDAITMKYNNPQDEAFAGLNPKQRALKMARLMEPLNDDLAKQYMTKANSLDERDFKKQEKIDIIGEKRKADEQEQVALQEAKEKWIVALKSGDKTAIQIADADYKALLGKAPSNVVYEMGQEENRRLRGQGIDLGQEKFEYQKERNIVEDEMSNLKSDEQKKQFWAKYSQLKSQFDKSFLLKEKESEAKAERQAKADKEVSGELAGKIAGLDLMIKSVDELNELYEKEGASGIAFQALTPNSKYNNIMSLSSENLGRVQSGGAINPEEVKTFKGLISWSPTGEPYADKLRRARNMAVVKRDAMRSKGGSLATSAPESPTATTQLPQASGPKIVYVGEE